jgi:hypothetical protein
MLAALAACAEQPGPTERLAPWVGRSEGDLVAAFGVPARVHEADGRRFLLFEERRTVLVAQPGWDRPYFGPWGPRWVGPPPPAQAVVSCEVTFALREGRVEGFVLHGAGCR